MLWVWQNNDDPGVKQKDKETKLLFQKGHTVYGLYSCKELPNRIVALSASGEVSLLTADTLEIKSFLDAKSTSVIFATLLSAVTTTFSTRNDGGVLVTLNSGSSKTSYLRILAIDEADSIAHQECEIPIDSEKIASVLVATPEYSASLPPTVNGFLMKLKSELSSLVKQVSPPLNLAGLSFISDTSKLSVSILSLTSSHTLLAAICSREIVLLLWDLQYSVLLASHSLSVPTVLSPSTLHIRLLPSTQALTKSKTQVVGQAIMILSSVPVQNVSEQKSSSILLVVPYIVPTVSTVAAAMGRGDAGKKWIKASEEKLRQTPEEQVRNTLLATMRNAMQSGRSQAAAAAFAKWVSQADEPIPKILDYNFVREILSIVLMSPSGEQKATPSVSAYVPDVIRYLLDRKLICSAMISTPGGLFGALRLRNDWTSINLAFDSVMDLTEAELVETLLTVVRRHKPSISKSASSAEDAMAVDVPAPSGSNDVTPLPSFLNNLATYPTSYGPLLVAFRRYIQDAEDVTAILGILDSWVNAKTNEKERLMTKQKDLKKTQHGVWVVPQGKPRIRGKEGKKEDKKEDIPSLEKIAKLLQVLLDASFLSLLLHPPAHQLLRGIKDQLNSEIMFGAAIQSLRGPLEPFAIAQEKALKESLISPQEREREMQKVDWRQRRKNIHANVDIGLYKLEELVL